MTVRRRGNKLERWEIALIKAMIADDRWPNDQDILAYFTRPTRSINHRAIAEIRTGKKHTAVTASAADDLEGFLASWPEIDAETGLSLRGDELLIKAREAMIAAVHTFNSGGLTFRAELFIVTAIIAWTYLLHAWFKREGIDYRHTKNQNGQKVVIKTPSGAEKFWELGQCLNRHSPYTIQIRGNRTFPPPRELYPLCPSDRIGPRLEGHSVIFLAIQDTPLLSLSPRRRFPRPTPERVFVADQSSSIFRNRSLGTATSANWNVT